MEIRPVTQKEYVLSRRAESIAFNMGLDLSAPHEDASELMKFRHALFDEGMLCSCIDIYPMQAVMNGHEVGLTGIGTVSTLPEKRRKGYIRELMKYSLGQARERGDVFAFLYPFSNVYYRQFGYEPCMARDIVTYPLRSLGVFEPSGTMEMYLPGNDRSDIEEVYRAFGSGKNFMILRDEELWRLRLDKDPFKSCRYVYLHRNDGGRADGYLVFSRKPGADMDVVIEEFAYLDFDALRSMLGFLGTFSGNSRDVVLTAPLSMRPELLFAEPNAVASRRSFDGMGRIVDAECALATLTLPEKKSVAVEVRDDFLDWNNATFKLSAHGAVTRVERTDTDPDMSCDVGTLAQLVSGFASLDECSALGKASVAGNKELLQTVFYQRDVFISDYF